MSTSRADRTLRPISLRLRPNPRMQLMRRSLFRYDAHQSLGEPQGPLGDSAMSTTTLTPGYFRVLIRLIRPFPDFDFAFIRPLRAKAVALLHLAPGARALDLGCGPGGSLPFLVNAVGAAGQVVGVEISPEVALNASRRIDRHRWKNVQIIEAPAETATLEGGFDGALMFGAPDVYGSEAALANILPHLRPGARVVCFGAKTSRRRLGWILNPLFRTIFPRLSFASTPIPDDAPWRTLAPHLNDLVVEEYFFGWMFLAAGTLRGTPHATA
jgi:ubiquinone/menaquinone biosynthesis C-methylase UbiE